MPDARPSSRRGRGCMLALLLVYGAALIVSHTVRALRPDVPPTMRSSRRVAVRVVDADRLLPREARVAYLDEGDPRAPAILLLHGSPGRKEHFDALIPHLATRYRVIAPDLPGFGASEHDVPDYSIRAHAHYVLELMDALELPAVHLVGFSMGGGVALELYDLAPGRVDSMTLLSAIGVQELELFGNYRLNHLVHAFQLGAIRLIEVGVPHFGLLDGAMLDRAYARNFYDTDQRPLRDILKRFEPPMLVIHGEHDFLVLPQAAEEHHRLVPQSSLQMLDASHFMVFNDGRGLARRILDFVDRVEAGEAPRRADATSARETAALEPFDPRSVPRFSGMALVLSLVMLTLATLVSEDLTCIAAGLLVGQGRVEFLSATLACFAGILLGDVSLFLAGRWLGRAALERRPLRWWIRPESVDRASAWFARRGPLVIGLSRFLPGARLPTYFAAGVLRTPFLWFVLYFALAVALWTPLLVGGAMLVGQRAFGYFDSFQRHALPAAALLGLWILFVVRIGLPMLSWEGRRRLLGRWRRLRNSEFWPPWAFYAPVLAYVLWLGLRHRHPLLFTAANPAMPAGGCISESKSEILAALDASGAPTARHRRVRGPDDVSAFMAEQGLDFPIVLKPDAGQRGSGVLVAREAAQIVRYFEHCEYQVIAQEYAPGDEFGVFYYRLPGEEHGHVFSITEKRVPQLTGDGERTLGQLILADERAVCMADVYFKLHARGIARVPARGEAVPLVELGTHCRGAIFVDGMRWRTDALERAIDAISRNYEGFYFGRYDLRTPDLAALGRGAGFKIVELNGVTSEATHVYDPGIGLLAAYRVLFRQWRLAFEIGRRNRERGARPATPRQLLELISTYRRTSRTHPA